MQALSDLSMKYEFKLVRNVHMYNHGLKCKYGEELYQTICESAPTKEEVILFWPDDFGLNRESTDKLIIDLLDWANQQDFFYKIYRGKRCIRPGDAS